MRWAALCGWVVLGGFAAHAQVAPTSARFALIIGVNTSVDTDVKPLRYADDDAARWQELFRLLGARTWLMARLDENTTRLHPQAAAEAVEPVDRALDELVSHVAEAIDAAHARHVPTELYVVYAGHGNVRDGEGYLALEDARLTTESLKSRVFSKLKADRAHLVADACYSSFLASGRGAGAGARRPVAGFTQSSGLDEVGLLLSTSSARESHEWEGFQAGVFSHELRSGLLGAADADHDGLISYREIAAFVDRANEKIANEKYRPDIHAHSPSGSDVLVDLRDALERRLEIKGAEGAHYLLEDSRGVRLADFHNGAHQAVTLLRPSAGGALYVRRLSDEREFSVPGTPNVLSLGELPNGAPKVGSRGAAHDAFSLVFALPFDEQNVVTWRPREVAELGGGEPNLTPWAVGAAALAATSLAAGAAFTVLGLNARAGVAVTDSQQAAAAANQRIATFNTTSLALYGAGAALAVVGTTLFIWANRLTHSSAGSGSLALVPTAGGGLGAVGSWSTAW